jgi:hypothetical protein
MTLAIHTSIGARVSGRWFPGLLLLLSSLVVLAQNSAHLELLPGDDDEHLTDEIYNSTPEWRTPTAYENGWRRGEQQPASRIQFGYDTAYEEMRASDSRYGMNNGLGGIDHPQNTQLRISF